MSGTLPRSRAYNSRQIVLEYTPTRTELVLAARALRRGTIMYKIDMLMILFTSGFAVYFTVIQPNVMYALINLLLGAVVVMNSLFPFRIWMHYTLNPHTLKATRAVFDAARAQFITGEKNVQMQWGEYQRVIETSRLFVFLLARVKAYQIVPKRAFSDQETLEQMRSLLREQIGQKKRPNRA